MPTLTVLRKPLCWDRYSKVEIQVSQCDYCLDRAPCLYVDTSEGEYGPISLCQKCLNNSFLLHLDLNKGPDALPPKPQATVP